MPFQWVTFLRDPRQAAQPFYADFLPPATAAETPQPEPQQAGSQSAGGKVRLSEAAVVAAVAAAVAAALGEDVGSDAPLLQAGLDSLGERIFYLSALFLCCHILD